jgi:hypothetical protein
MKIKGEHYATMLDASRKIWAKVSKPLKQVEQDKNKIAVSWQLFWLIDFDLSNDNTHPAFRGGRERINDYIPTWRQSFNDADYNDAHIQTAMLRILRELNKKD